MGRVRIIGVPWLGTRVPSRLTREDRTGETTRMSSVTSDRFKNLSEDDRSLLEGSLREGFEVTDLLEEDVDSMNPIAPTTEGSEGKRKKRPLSKDEIEEYINTLVEQKLEARQAEAQAPILKPVQVRAAPPSLFNGKRGSFMFFARKLASYAKLTNVPNAKWVALAVQHLEERCNNSAEFIRK
eukprot:jgi/Botrbrau1/600/Bobra.0010s0064.1